METKTVIHCLTTLFSLFGMPNYIHSDQGRSFLLGKMREFLHSHGIANSQTAPYNPRCNSQVERYSVVLWRSIQLLLRSHGLPDSQWEDVLTDVLHASRYLLCTATNCTSHERMFTYLLSHPLFLLYLPSWSQDLF